MTDRFSSAAYRKLVERTIERVLELSTLKGGEYAGDEDRLANFRRHGDALEIPMELVWQIYAGKHWDALTQYVRDLRTGMQRARLEPIEGRIDDLIVYLLLFKAILWERQGDAGVVSAANPQGDTERCDRGKQEAGNAAMAEIMSEQRECMPVTDAECNRRYDSYMRNR
jgi:hypothetical protein